MTKKKLRVITLLFCTTTFICAQSARDAASNSADKAQTAPQETEAKDLKTDLDKMHILLEQMQRNVAFVSPGDTPLKHQFQLEIEMWQLLIRDMEKKATVQETR